MCIFYTFDDASCELYRCTFEPYFFLKNLLNDLFVFHAIFWVSPETIKWENKIKQNFIAIYRIWGIQSTHKKNKRKKTREREGDTSWIQYLLWPKKNKFVRVWIAFGAKKKRVCISLCVVCGVICSVFCEKPLQSWPTLKNDGAHRRHRRRVVYRQCHILAALCRHRHHFSHGRQFHSCHCGDQHFYQHLIQPHYDQHCPGLYFLCITIYSTTSQRTRDTLAISYNSMEINWINPNDHRCDAIKLNSISCFRPIYLALGELFQLNSEMILLRFDTLEPQESIHVQCAKAIQLIDCTRIVVNGRTVRVRLSLETRKKKSIRW